MKIVYSLLSIAVMLSLTGCLNDSGRSYSPCDGVDRPSVAIIERIFANYTQRTNDAVQDKKAPIYLDLVEPHSFSALNIHLWASLYAGERLIIDRQSNDSCSVASAYESYIDSIHVNIVSFSGGDLSGTDITDQFIVTAHNLYPNPGFYSSLPLLEWNALGVLTEASATQELAVLSFVDGVSLPQGIYVLELEVYLDSGALFEIELPEIILE